jgi:hypothetical protein
MYRFNPFGAVRFQISPAEVPSRSPGKCIDGGGYGSAVKAFTARFRQFAQRLCLQGKAAPLARTGSTTFEERLEEGCKGRLVPVRCKSGRFPAPKKGRDRLDREAILGIANSRLKQVWKRQPSEPAV